MLRRLELKAWIIHFIRNLVLRFLIALTAFRAAGQAPNGAWVYPSATGNLLYQLDSRGQRITDFSQCGYRGGTEPLPNVSALIPQSRWVVVSPGTGDDTALIQAAIDSVEAMTPDANGWRGVVYLNAGEYQLATTLTIQASGVVLKGTGDSSTTGTRLRATDARQYTLISVTYSTSPDPEGTYDSSGPAGTGKAVYPRSLYYGQLQQRMKWPGSDNIWLDSTTSPQSFASLGWMPISTTPNQTGNETCATFVSDDT